MYKIGIAAVALAALLFGLWFWMATFHDSAQVEEGGSPDSTDSSTGDFSSWKEFEPQSHLFKVKLPYPPQYAKDFLPIPESDKKRRFDMYASEKIDGALFLVSVITYPEEVTTDPVENTLRQTIEELIKNKPDNRLTKSEHGFFDRHPALDFTIGNSEFFVEGKAFIIGQTVYILSYVTRIGQFDLRDYEYFIDSFQPLER